MRVSVALFLVIAACGGAPAKSASTCTGDAAAPEIQALGATSGGANSWVELAVSRVDPSNNQVLLDGKEVPIARLTGPAEDEGPVIDPSAGQLTPRQQKQRTGARESNGPAHVVAFRVPAGSAPGSHAITFRTCGATSESVAFEVLPTAAPQISSITVVRGDVYPALVIKGANLSSVDEVVVRDKDGTATSITNVTRIDDSQLRAPVDQPGTYDVFVRSKGGLGGGPPGGVAVVR